jgi:hypothetical protein
LHTRQLQHQHDLTGRVGASVVDLAQGVRQQAREDCSQPVEKMAAGREDS